MHNLKNLSILFLLFLLPNAFAQTTERVKEIRKMYAKVQATLAEDVDISIQQFVKTSIQRSEAAVGMTSYDITYFPYSHIANSYDFIRAKRKNVSTTEVSEILYQNGKPAFFFKRAEIYGEVFETRIYWNLNGTVDTFLYQQVQSDGKKVNAKCTTEERSQITSAAYDFAKREYLRASKAYTED